MSEPLFLGADLDVQEDPDLFLAEPQPDPTPPVLNADAASAQLRGGLREGDPVFGSDTGDTEDGAPFDTSGG